MIGNPNANDGSELVAHAHAKVMAFLRKAPPTAEVELWNVTTGFGRHVARFQVTADADALARAIVETAMADPDGAVSAREYVVAFGDDRCQFTLRFMTRADGPGGEKPS